MLNENINLLIKLKTKAKQTLELLIGSDEANSVRSLYQNDESSPSAPPICMTFNYGMFMIS